MASTLERMRSFILKGSTPSTSSTDNLEPEIGFRLSFKETNGELCVKILGGRNLPVRYGSIKPQGYLVKVRVFPGREKYETEMIRNSAPCFNQEFTFATTGENFNGKFVTFTAYAVLDVKEDKTRPKRRLSFKERVEAMLDSGGSSTTDKITLRPATDNRRTIGAVTYNLDRGAFNKTARFGTSISTADIWRVLKRISSGIQIESRESKKGSLEVTLCYSESENGKNDMISVSLSKLRCSMRTMQEHEKLEGDLYIKMIVFEYNVQVAKWKSNTFPPTISMKIESKTATIQALVNRFNLEQVQIVIKLKSRNSLQKKTLLGTLTIGHGHNHIWTRIIETPSTPMTMLLDFV